jgi:hypothetical protein
MDLEDLVICEGWMKIGQIQSVLPNKREALFGGKSTTICMSTSNWVSTHSRATGVKMP